MDKIKSFDQLSLIILNKFSEKFTNHAILKGGMVFKLLGSPRSTNDLDYVFIPYQSKKQIVDLIFKELNNLFPENVTYAMHSKMIRYYINVNGVKAQIEVSVSKECKSTALSTSSIAKQLEYSPRIIRVMSYDQALSHKLAAWNERELYRDLYDAYYLFTILDEKPDLKILNSRLQNIQSMKPGVKTKKMTLHEFIIKLDTSVSNLSEKKLKSELHDYFTLTELTGLDKKIKIGLKKLIDYLKEK